MEESEIKRFERLCKEVGIQTTTPNFYVTQDQVFKLFKLIVKDCGKTVVSKNPSEVTSKDDDILFTLKRYSRVGLTLKEISSLSGCPLSKTEKAIEELEKEKIIEKEGKRWILKKTS